MTNQSDGEVLPRIRAALDAACEVLSRFTPGAIEYENKIGHDPVTEADRAVDAVLQSTLLQEGEGWLSEEGVDDKTRLGKNRVWVVDPLDGTREFIAGVPEFCVSIALVEDGRPVAGGICNPVTNEKFIGSLQTGVTYNGRPVKSSQRTSLDGAVVLASRSELKRGDWEPFKTAPFKIRAMGSVAYKLALVSAGLADATFTLSEKHEWDIAGGSALVLSSGGFVQTLENTELRCNRQNPILSGLVASGPFLRAELMTLLDDHLHSAHRP
jgi:myo-inositol-1(or 4)-monophosphatase